MKKILVLLGVVACAAGASSLQAAPQTTTSTNSVKRHYSTVYITSVTALGSHIPLVVRAYDGSIIPMSGVYVYGKTDIVNTGSNLNVASALFERDPAITPSAGHR